MSVGAREMLMLRKRLTNNEGIPMSISTQDEIYGFGGSLYRAMQLDLERLSDLRRNNEVFLLLMQRDIFAILSQLDGVPTVCRLETREPDVHRQFFLSKKTFER